MSCSRQYPLVIKNKKKSLIFQQSKRKLRGFTSHKNSGIPTHASCSLFPTKLIQHTLISNFLFEIQDNYYDELHSILRSSIMKSTQSTFIQVIDRLRKNIFNNHHSLLASLLTQNVKEFSKNYEKACLKGVEPFNFSNLMLVGPKGEGKTSLFLLLIGQPFSANEESTNFYFLNDIFSPTEKDSSLNRIEGQTRRNEGQSSGRSTDGGRIGCITEIIGGTNETQSAPFCAGENTWRVGK